jgi:Tfp pilus assembly PilM family ATPase
LARFLALDWDQNQLHVVSANVRGTTVHVQKAAVWADSHVPNPAEAEDMGLLLRERLKEAGIAAAPVLACIGRDRVIVKEVRFPQVPDSEEPALVRFQAVKELTDNADDVVIDYVTAGNSSSGERKAAALVVRREVLATYQKLCSSAGLRLQALTPRLIGVSGCVRQVIGKTIVTPPPEPADAVIAVVVIGEKTAELCVLRDHTFLLTRSLSAGPNLSAEVRRNLAVHAGQTPQHPIKAVYLAGKGAGELRDRLNESLEIPVHTFDPFAGSEAQDLPAGNRGTFAGAVGLLWAQAAGQMPINFVAPRQPKPPANPHTRLYRVAAIAALVLVVGLVGMGQVVAAIKNGRAEQDENQKADVAVSLKTAKENSARLKELEVVGTPVWGDELYDLTVRIARLRAAAEQELKAKKRKADSKDLTLLRVTSVTFEGTNRSATSKTASKIAGRMTIKGTLVNKSRKPLDDLISDYRRDSLYYQVGPPKVENNETFTLVIELTRRPPGEYKSRLEGDQAAAVEKDKDKGTKAKGKK